MNTTLLLAMVIGAPALKDKPEAKPSIFGEWAVESRFDGGTPSSDKNIWIFCPGSVAEIRDPIERSVISDLTYTVSTDDRGKAIDFTESQGNGRPAPRQGIYKIEGDTLTVSFSTDKLPRPTSFDTSKGLGYYVLVLKRVKK